MNDALRKLVREQLDCDPESVSAEFQESGLTNENYIIAKGQEKYVVRMAGVASGLLGINRAAELAALEAIRPIHTAPELVYFSAETGDMITKFIVGGRQFTNEEFSTPEVFERVAATLRSVHALAIRFEFCPYRDVDSRLETARGRGVELPGSLPGLLETLRAVRSDLGHDAEAYQGLCHNDPWVNNFLYDGDIRLLDWEYAGTGDVFFDLTSTCFSFPDEQKVAFLEEYFGCANERHLARVKLMAYVVVFWNATWALLQIGSMNDKCDYAGMAKGMFGHLETLAEGFRKGQSS